MDPFGGVIDRDENNEPTGVLREKAAELVSHLLKDSHDDRVKYVEAALDRCLRFGITQVQTNDENSW